MDTSTAIRTAYQMHAEWVGPVSNGYDLDRIHASMLQEYRWNRKDPSRCTSECARETAGKLILLGKVRKVLSHTHTYECIDASGRCMVTGEV